MAEQVATHIVRDPQVRFGKPTIDGYRIAVHDVVVWTQQGQTPEMIADDFPLTLGQIHAALAYYYDHKHEIDLELEEDRAEFERLRSEPENLERTNRVRRAMEERRAREANGG